MFLSHSAPKDGGDPELLRKHLDLVAARTEEYAKFFKAGKEARVAGMLHDLGKYSGLFLQRLRNEVSRLDHWSPGAYAAVCHYGLKALGATLAIQGHHIGLQHAYPKELAKDLNLEDLARKHPPDLRITEKDHQKLLKRLQEDGLDLPSVPEESIYDIHMPHVAGMLDVRMLFSALVDADFVETEAHFQREYRPEGKPLDPEMALHVLGQYMDELRRNSEAAGQVNQLREDLYQACLAAAEQPPGLFTLSAPTGAGKTLAMLAFALKHAQVHSGSLRRIVVVIPYLSIIEQTARIYEGVFRPYFGEHYVLEHHSLAGTRREKGGTQDNEESGVRTARLLAENWDAPLVVTTSVQCLESLFANRPGACRKLHRLAGSVILFDEVQTLPPRLAVPTLAALARLTDRYGATVVFSTATQPAFKHLDKEVCQCTPTGWQPGEIVSPALQLFDRARRTQIEWEVEQERSWKELAGELEEEENRQVLCIVNLKRHAQQLAGFLRDREVEGLFHLSTSMCPAHREQVLGRVRDYLERGQPCRLISTQCVEAGVDVDFPVVFRALGPLEAIAQAAGRCNRNGRLSEPGIVRVFKPESEPDGKFLYPPGGYGQATAVTCMLLQARGPERMDINDPALFEEYYRQLYDLTGNARVPGDLEDALVRRHFVDVADQYRLINQDSINVLVPYNPEVFLQLRDRIEEEGRLTRDWIRAARPYVVSLFRTQESNFLNPVPLGRGEKADDWFIYLEPNPERPKHYDELLGLNPPGGPQEWMI